MSQSIIRQAKAAKRLDKPRPLKLMQQNRPSPVDGHARLNTVEEIMALVEHVSAVLKEGNWDNTLLCNILLLCSNLKTYGQHLENIYKDQLDRAFINFRNGSRDDHLDNRSRVCLLEIIELRATNWQGGDELSTYYKSKTNVEIVPPPDTPTLTQPLMIQALSPTAPQPPMLSPGEVIKNSGKFAKPTKIPGKNYCKDEVVIRNSDSGKVMGIKGRRVHMIEELSETIISFQRVNPGAKERLVQITGPNEEKINYAKQLMEETIRRNASPIRLEQPEKEGDGSSSSLNSSASDESNRFASGIRRSTLLHSLSTSDAHLREYKHTVTVGNQSIKIIGSDIELVTIAKLVLDEHFNPQEAGEYYSAYDEEMSIQTPALPNTVSTPTSSVTVNTGTVAAQAPAKLSSSSRVDSQESNTTSESEETYKVTTTATSEPVAITPSTPTTDTSNIQLTVVRQPLFPDSPKEAFNAAEESDGTGAVSARNRRAFFAQTNLSTQNQQPQQPKESAASVTHAGTIRVYCREDLLEFALLPLSQRKPQDWNNLVVFGVAKKTVELFDPAVYIQKWKEMDGSCAVISATDIDPADLE